MKKLLLATIFASFTAHNCEIPQEALSSDLIIIGEQHGRRAQPIYVMCVLEYLASNNISTALAMEHIHQDHKESTSNWYNVFESADQLAIELKWWKSGWPSWMIYRPLLSKAYDLKLPLIATDSADVLNKEEIQNIWNENFTQAYEGWAKIIRDYHQNNIEPQKLDELILLQMSRDIHMSRAINDYVKQYPEHLIIHYTGQDHARNNFSIKQLLSDLDVLTIAQNCPKLNHQFDFIANKCEN